MSSGHLPDGTAYIIMEYLSGEPLSVRLRNLGGKLQLPDIFRISRQIASAPPPPTPRESFTET